MSQKTKITQKYAKVLKSISSKVGKSIQEIKAMSPHQLREYIEKKNQKKLRFDSEFPYIGRGNVLRDDFIGTNELNKSKE